ncbi:D-alanyl-D-alanine carboxypeptidase/D-alanyl-D-alanine endopeptidase [Coralloluteibacterium stylophorae]|uniref:D-alanyl-D-alanine carboxypeptidase/D-alanyl-D-alanine-endopeptidase n=1 Tax=Coralloluteibacterium stylophorae TaxID=1776034 RepID=A0AAP2CAR8_9GAMM|nr:D-alanyl-D-alanine carboxypeptidase/D-alanyl-D-alanine-endopeptidase [Coralloluteibacterium stylophorae]MBS7456505.1 D-alanyl-D-alanine carboxypeptidase/D-alanyl-D-alanine-endopeptidase [Coralloluteibacterium stylophorae]
MLRLHRTAPSAGRRASAACLALLLAACASAPVAPPAAPAVEPAARPAPPRPSAPLPPPPASDAPLQARIAAFVAQPRFAAADWGVQVVALDSGTTLAARQAGKLAIPASNAKLYSAAMALHALGPDHRFVTRLAATATPAADGTLAGDLVLVGGGDPVLGLDAEGRADTGWADALASALAARGLRRVRGDLLADETLYAGPPTPSGWEAADLLTAYAPPVPALSVQGNAFGLTIARDGQACCRFGVDPQAAGVEVLDRLDHSGVGATDELGLYRPLGSSGLVVHGRVSAAPSVRGFRLAAPDPARMAAALLREALAHAGIVVDGGIRVRRWPDTPVPAPQPLAEVASPPLAEIVRRALKDSDNLIAQHLWLQAGRAAQAAGSCATPGAIPRTAEAWGRCALDALLADAGIPRDEVLLEEGSGLSRRDLVTPRATTALIAWTQRQPWAAAYLDALPVAGVDGTLRNRFRGTPLQGRLRAKTGTVRYSNALSGVVTFAGGRPLAFSLLLDRYEPPRDAQGRPVGPSAREDIDALAALIAGAGGTAGSDSP